VKRASCPHGETLAGTAGSPAGAGEPAMAADPLVLLRDYRTCCKMA